MAERRMFARSIINSAKFLMMPVSSRLLYYDLGMAADDDGIVEAFSVMRLTGATEDDLRMLVTKGFISVLNENLVAFIVDWSRNNQIKKDRYRPSVYHDLLVQFQSGSSLEPEWNQSGAQLEPQDSIGKYSIVKGNTPPTPSEGADERFEKFWSVYPKKIGKGAALKAFKKIKPSAELLQTMVNAVEAQKQSQQWTKENGQFIPNPTTWLNQERWEDESTTLPFNNESVDDWISSL